MLNTAWKSIFQNTKEVDKYLGSLVGMGVMPSMPSEKAVLKLEKSISLWSAVPLSPISSFRVCNVFLLPIISYVAMFSLLSKQQVPRVRCALLRFMTRILIISVQGMCTLGKKYLFKTGLRDPLWYNVAALLKNGREVIDGDDPYSPVSYDNQVKLGRARFLELTGGSWGDFQDSISARISPGKLQAHIYSSIAAAVSEAAGTTWLDIKLKRWKEANPHGLASVLQ